MCVIWKCLLKAYSLCWIYYLAWQTNMSLSKLPKLVTTMNIPKMIIAKPLHQMITAWTLLKLEWMPLLILVTMSLP